MTWRLAGALVALRSDVNARWPSRDKTSDGTIGDAAHATRASDHNPWVVVDGVGVVRALDVDVDGIDAAWYAEQLRLVGAAGDRRLNGGGYVIYNRRITTADFSGWRVYTGTNPHTSHVHVSFSQYQSGFDDASPWTFLRSETDVDQNTRFYTSYPGNRAEGETHSFGEYLGDQYYIVNDMGKIHVPKMIAMLAQIMANQQDDLNAEDVLSQLDESFRTALNETILPVLGDAVREAVQEAEDATPEEIANAVVGKLHDRLKPAA